MEFFSPEIIGAIMIGCMLFAIFVGFPISFTLIFAMVYEVIGRHFFNRPTLWSFDISRMLAGALFMLGAAYTLSKGIHIRADFLYRNWKVKNQAMVDLFLYLLFFFPGFWFFSG